MLPGVSDRQLKSQLGWTVKTFPSLLAVGGVSSAEAADWSAYRWPFWNEGLRVIELLQLASLNVRISKKTDGSILALFDLAPEVSSVASTAFY